MVDFGPGAEPDEEILRTERWSIRTVYDQKRIFFYVSELNSCYCYGYASSLSVCSESLDDIFNWLNYDEPIFLFGDYDGLPKCLLGKKVYKQSSRRNDTSSAIFYQVQMSIQPKPILDCKYLFSFQGSTITHPIRAKIPGIFTNANVEKIGNQAAFLQENYTFFWMYPMEERPKLRQSYLEVMNDSKFILCPRGAGLTSIRFFEALRVGRIPVLIADDAKLPLENKIDYSQFIVRVPEKDIENTLDYIHEFCKDHDLRASSELARQVSLYYFEDVDRFLIEDDA